MPEGPGKYDDLCTYVAEQIGLREGGEPGGVILIVVNGDKGNGFSCQADFQTLIRIPELLESVVEQLKKDLEDKFGSGSKQ